MTHGGRGAASLDYRRLYEEDAEKIAERDSLISSLREQVRGLSAENRKLRLREVPLSSRGHEWLMNLQYKVKALAAEVGDFRSGEKYANMRAYHAEQLAAKDRETKKLKRELADALRQSVNVRNIWDGIVGDLEAEHAKVLRGKDGAIAGLTAENHRLHAMLGEERARNRSMASDLMKARTELEEEREKVCKLKSQIKKDFENSSKPSSQSPNRRKIPNSREPTGRKPGGQPGHAGHRRKWHVPMSTVLLPEPEEFSDGTRYRFTGRTIAKQLINIRVTVEAVEYHAREFRDLHTRLRVHADFPDGVVNDVNYGGSVKAFAFLLNNRCNVSVANVADFLSELTGGELRISTGMINGLSKEFSMKTVKDQQQMFADLLLSPVMNTDLTTVRVNGQRKNVLVATTPDKVMYFFRERKGHDAVKGTPVEDYQHKLVHDHDKTFYSYGGAHQECLQHPERYLKGCAETERGLTWHLQMRDLIKEMIHFRNGLYPKDGRSPQDRRDPNEIDPDRVAAFGARYDEILGLARSEYEYEPPSKHFPDGFNLCKKMEKYRDEHLLFLHDKNVPPTNNLAERRLRVVKRKGAQVMSFRSDDGIEHYCDSLGVIESMRAQGANLYEGAASKFDIQLERSVKPGIASP